MKNILIISSLFYPNEKSGAEVVARNLANACVERGYNVHVVSLHTNSDKKEIRDGIVYVYWKNLSDINLLNIDSFNILRRLFWHVYDIFSSAYERKLKDYIRTHSIDTVFTHNIKGFGLKGIVRVCTTLSSVKWVHTVHDIQYANPSGLLFLGKEHSFFNNFFIIWMYTRLIKIVWKSPNCLIFPSFFLKEYYQTKNLFNDGHEAVIRNPLYKKPKKFLPPNIASLPISMVYVGQVAEYKGILGLCSIISTMNDINLFIYGRGLAVEIIKNKYPSVNLCGVCDNDEIDFVFQSYDISVLPTLVYENFPTSIVESLRNGVPVLTRDIGGAAELIEEGINGWTFKSDNDFRRRLKQLVEMKKQDPSCFYNMRQACIKSVEHLTFDNYFKEIEAKLK